MYKKNASGWRKHLDFIIINILCMHVSFTLAYLVRHGNVMLYVDSQYQQIMIVMAILDVLIAILFSSFKNVLKRGYFAEFMAAVKHVCIVEVVTIFFVFSVQQGMEYSRIVFYVFPAIYVVLTTLARYGWKRFLRRNKKLLGERSLLLITTKKQAGEIIPEFQNSEYEKYQLKGVVFIDAPCEKTTIFDVPVLDRKDAVAYAYGGWVDAVMISVTSEMLYPTELVEDFSKMGIVVHRVVARKQGEESRQQVERIGNYTVLTTSINYATEEQLLVKRVMDIIGGLVGCVLAGLVCLIFGPVIYFQSPGPILFTQVRVGEKGKPFKIYKLRTMYPDAEERKAELLSENRIKDGHMFKLDYDPRIIGNKKLPDGTVKKGIGSFLREHSLDEFPQFLNVLKGDMSLVGTRPPTMDEWEKYELHHRARLAIKPGLTGMWQVSGRSNITDFEEVVKLDTKYISEWNLGLDIKILVKTVLVIFGGRGAL